MSDTEAIQTLIDTGHATLPPGTYSASGLRPSNGRLSLHGYGATIEHDGGDAEDLFYLDSDCVVDIRGVGASGCPRAFCRPNNQGREIPSAVFEDCRVSNCGQGVSLNCHALNATVHRCTFTDITYDNSAEAIRLGFNANGASLAKLGIHHVSQCVVRNVHSTGGGEAHGVICYGDRCIVRDNWVFDVTSGEGHEQDGGEPIYIKSRWGLVECNHVHNGNGHGMIAVKGKNKGNTGAPFGYIATVRGNVLTHDAAQRPKAGVMYAVDDTVICDNRFDLPDGDRGFPDILNLNGLGARMAHWDNSAPDRPKGLRSR